MPMWTAEQKRAIETRGHGLLVSAAAGSGKTAVLTQRTVDYVTSGGKLDRLLIVTFTRLAAAEMRQRIASALSDCYDLNPTEHLKQQKMLVYNAKISTIDSFYNELLKKNFQKLGLSPDFSILDEVEYRSIKNTILEELLEDYYSSYKNDFPELLFIFGGEQDSNILSAAINKLYSYLQSIPFSERWMQIQYEKYSNSQFWSDYACTYVSHRLESYISILQDVLASGTFKPDACEKINSEFVFIQSLKIACDEKQWDMAVGLVNSYSFLRSPSCANDNLMMQKYKKFRNDLKAFLNESIFLIDTSDLENDLNRLRKGIKALFSIVAEYRNMIEAEFYKRNRFSFDFISQKALSLLVEEYDFESGAFVPTEFAEELSESFDEILIDEYQDVNDLQDLFFRALSCDDKNIFAVGDVKQSIYGFRHANPSNFIKKKLKLENIDLNMNFRSKKNILDFINFIFSVLFNEDVTSLEYDDGEKLYCGLNSEEKNDDVELHLIDYLEEELEEVETVNKIVLQARLCAQRIKELIGSGYSIFDKDLGAKRAAELYDFAIILRSKINLPIYEQVFKEEGVPLQQAAGTSFWDSIEVNIICAMLKVIDNPYDELSVFAVMFSDIYSFSADELAQLKSTNKNAGLFDIVTKISAENKKCAAFLSDMEHYRLIAQNYPVYKLIWEIFTKTEYLSKVSFLPLGYIKKDNLMKFYSFARKYSDSISGGLFKFIKFIDENRETRSGGDESLSSHGNYVKIMTIHASKGLEFPVCIIPELSNTINFNDLKSPLLIDEQLGVATMIRDTDMIYETTTLQRELISKNILKRLIAEELRILYVALTRAREKLILISASKKYNEKEFMQKALGLDLLGKLYPMVTLSLKSFEDFILNCCVHHTNAKLLLNNFSREIQTDGTLCVQIHKKVESLEENIEEKAIEANIDIEKLKKRFEFKYDNKFINIPAKLSVTEITKSIENDKESELLIKQESTMKKPRFLEDDPLTAAEKGNAIHSFCRYADLFADTKKEIERLTDNYYITKTEAESINIKKIEAFKKSIVFDIIKKADNIRREENFITNIPAYYYKPGVFGDKNILIQGAIDLLCEFSDGFILIDYKTDRATEAELVKRYSKQLFFYKYAIEQNYEKAVKSIYIWSFHLSKAIECSNEVNAELMIAE